VDDFLLQEKSLQIQPAEIGSLDCNIELLQSGYWARLKERFGWVAHAFRVVLRNESCPLLLLSRRLAPAFTLVYVPLGPSIAEPEKGREELLISLSHKIAACRDREGRPVLPEDAFAIRFDLPWYRAGLGNFPESMNEQTRLRKAAVDIQPASTVVLDIRPPEQDIIAAMKHKTRYNVRLSLRKSIQVTESGAEDLSLWYDLYQRTAERDRIAIHSREYYHAQFRLASEYEGRAPEYRLLLARSEGEVLAGIIVATWGKKAWYLFGASGARKRNLMPTYALQWRAIQMARERRCESYDLFGIPPSSDPDHPMHGLFQFKTGFGGTIINRYGCWDVVLNRSKYALYRKAERARRYYYKVLRKRALN
jgi:lipid II:glycine glycyltransferase (peptidoglycan interpeptide bridge formation enzyme)